MPRPLRSVAVSAVLVLAAALLPLAWSPADAAPDDPMYQRLARFEPGGPKARVEPSHFSAVRVDTAAVRAELSAAPRAGSSASTAFRLPTPTGGTERFAVQRTRVMQPGLAADHPELQTWAGRSLDRPGTTVALDVTPMGFHAAVRGPDGQGAWYVDPAYDRRGTTTHLSYYGASLDERPDLVERELPSIQRDVAAARAKAEAGAGGVVQQRVYRLALVNDPSYAADFGTANVLAEKVTLINRVNQVYNADLAIKLVLVDGTDDLNLDTAAKATGPDGPCGANRCFEPTQLAACDVPTLVRNQVVLGQLLGASDYDVGHLVLGVDGGGIAGLGVVGSIEKGYGCTGLPMPTGDFMALDYVAHELGHQFGGNHTFNGVQGACGGGNRAAQASVEPGSGSSIMAYAGICQQDNLQPHTDPYFSQRTLTEATRYTGRPAARVIEVQDVSLRSFGVGDSITLGYPGSGRTFTLVRGGTGRTAYDATNLARAVEALTGRDVTVAGWGYDPYALIFAEQPVFPAPLTRPGRTGFQVMFASDPDPYTTRSAREDQAPLEVTSTSPGVSAHVGETARGGAPGNEGFEVVTTGNHGPVVTAPPNRTIPMRTPFTLTGSATDADGDSLTYLWEQNDRGGRVGTSLVSNAKRNGPLFRVFGRAARVTAEGALQTPSPGLNIAGTDPSRTFPDMAQILSGNTNAKSGRCPAVRAKRPVKPRPRDCYSEFLPVAGYVGTVGTHPRRAAMHFRLTARDTGFASAAELFGGGVGHDDVTLRIDRGAGPFLVSSFSKGGTARAGKRAAITWHVNGTRPLARRVKVVLSTDGGRTWDRVLDGSTANDGRVVVRMPKVRTNQARVMVQAIDNYFFDVNDRPFRIR